jgi:hypothetical protein
VGAMTCAAAVLLLLLAGCIEGPPAGPGRSSKIAKLFGGADNAGIVASPERVEAVKLRRPGRAEAGKPYNQWPGIGTPVRVPPDAASRFARGLTSESTYPRFDLPKGCDPTPGYLLRFWADGRSIDVCFCFECGILFTYRGPDALWYANFDESSPALAALFLKVFPADADLRRIAAKENP